MEVNDSEIYIGDKGDISMKIFSILPDSQVSDYYQYLVYFNISYHQWPGRSHDRRNSTNREK